MAKHSWLRPELQQYGDETRHMNDSNCTERYSKLDIILASTLFAVTVGYMLFGPSRKAPQPGRHRERRLHARTRPRIPVLVMPLSETIH